MAIGAAGVSVCLPARSEAATIGAIVAEAVRLELVSEVVVLDDGSTDDTAAVARAAGARVVSEASVLPETGPGSGKGNAMWKSLYACNGDIICWVDADLRNFRGEYIERLCAPLLAQPDTMFVKAFYTRSFEGAPTGGGRVTELVARPLLNLLWPQLSGLVQPLAGEYAARRSLLEQLPFPCGYGVELALLVDTLDLVGLEALAQVDLGVRVHRHHDERRLGRMAAEIMRTAFDRLARRGDLTDLGALGDSLTQFDRGATGFSSRSHSVLGLERPPMATVAEYADRAWS